ncbi:hypothetical protein ACIGPN_39710 [Streptomyces afghaniensis]|uniref:hypothetical protein n=1 Tax=Streptomyces afghaniensis TaxID=66865 RepID=UPI0037D49FC1
MSEPPDHSAARERTLGVSGNALSDALARHVKVTSIDDVLAFYSTCEDEIRAARSSVWLWAWVLNRVRSILPLLREGGGRGDRLHPRRHGPGPGPFECGRCGGTSIELRRRETGTLILALLTHGLQYEAERPERPLEPGHQVGVEGPGNARPDSGFRELTGIRGTFCGRLPRASNGISLVARSPAAL